MNCLNLARRLSISKHSKNLIKGKLAPILKFQFRCCSSALKILGIRENDVFNKIIYNEVLGEKIFKKKPESTAPIFLKYVLDEDKQEEQKNIPEEDSEIAYFPYEIKTPFLKEDPEAISIKKSFPEQLVNFTPSDNEKIKSLEWGSKELKIDFKSLEKPQKWANKYLDHLDCDNIDEVFKFGSSNPNVKVSKVSCGGCGALLHCSDPSLPGFIPAEVFEKLSVPELQSELCQRCLYLREFDVSLGVNVSPSEYIKIISKIKEKEALVILMIDLLDFPCSIFPGIIDLVGANKPVLIVGNKVDLLMHDVPNFFSNYQKALLWSLKNEGINLQNIVHVALISAKTGYGVENLITELHLKWGTKGDVYLIGCTNVGKSTLFNTLIQSDYCKVKAVNLLHRATISAWPGTTLNLLKFPILKINESRLALRYHRLRIQEKEEAALQKIQWMGQNIKMEQIPLTGHVGKTFAKDTPLTSGEEKTKGLNPLMDDFIKGRWFYDTPGVVHKDQIVNLLTTSELMLTVPRKMLLPRNFRMKPGTSLFIAGLARLDFISGADFVWFTVFASEELPLTVTKLEDADYVYEKLLGSPLFRVPMKGRERLAKWPKFSSKKFEVVGKVAREHSTTFNRDARRKLADADIVLSSAGWISVNVPRTGERCKLEAWTPEGRGLHLREKPIITKGFAFRGKRIPGTPAYKNVLTESEGLSLTDELPY